MPRKVNRRKKRDESQIHRKIPLTPPPSEPESFIVKIFHKTNYLLKNHPYIIFMIPLMYEFYNSYKQEI